LIAAHANLEIQNPTGTPLENAASGSRVEVVNALIAAGAKVDARNVNGVTALQLAVDAYQPTKRTTACMTALINAGANLELHGYPAPPLGIAAENGDLDTVKLLLSAKANIESVDDYGATPVINAAQGGDVPTLRALVAANADLHHITSLGDGIFVRAVMGAAPFDNGGKLEMVQALINLNLDINSHGFEGRTAAEFASANDRIDILNVLIAAHANLNIKDNSGITPLIAAASNHSLKTLQALIDQKVDLNTECHYYGTALIQAVMGYSEFVEGVSALISAHADLNVKDGQGMTALSWARLNHFEQSAKLIADAGGSIY
jgi:ankyrin repeat protein